MTKMEIVFIVFAVAILVAVTCFTYVVVVDPIERWQQRRRDRRAYDLEWQRAQVIAENQLIADQAVASIRDLAREQRREPGR